ncbi:MAG: GHKL domain-containing protein [Clostridiaceae bacterium]|nr:GHKL domain-containing protein [Clostridiaceae bacterium]
MGNISFAREILFDFWESIIVLVYFTCLNNIKQFIRQNRFKSIVFILLYTFFTYWATNYISPIFHTLCIAAFMIIVLSFITKSSFYSSTITVIVIGVTLIVTESIILVIGMTLLNTNMSELLAVPNNKFVHALCCKIAQSGLAILLYRFNVSIKIHNEINEGKSAFSFVIMQVFMMSVFMASVNYVVSQQKNVTHYNILLFIIYLLYVILCFIDLNERENMLKLKYKMDEQQEYVKNMETIVEIIRREKHDFTNHLNTLLAICMLKKPDALEKMELYIRQLTNNLKSSVRCFNSGNVYIDGLLAVKNNFAFENDIYLEVDIEAPFSQADVNNSHLTSIVGNILDNAFESFLSVPEKSGKVVSLCTYIENDKFYLSISDNGPMIPHEIREKIFESGFSTKDVDDKKDRGYGLYIVKKFVQQNNGNISVFSSEEETEFLITFNVRKNNNGKVSEEDHQCHSA